MSLTRIHIKQLNLTIARYITDVNLRLAWFFQNISHKRGTSPLCYSRQVGSVILRQTLLVHFYNSRILDLSP